jgi:GT2 family glycosyltransferase
MAPTVSAIVVSFADPDATRETVRSLVFQSEPPEEILVVDNHPSAATAAVAASWELPQVRVLEPQGNVGYAKGCNRAAREARGEWLLFLNPDAPAEPGCVAALRSAAGDPGVAVLGAQVLLPDGATINAGDNPIHLVGLSWSGGYGKPREAGPPRDVAGVSGAALMARADVFRELGGYADDYFMYHEDVDLCWRVRLAGWRVAFVPRAAVRHDYDFVKGPVKWRRLEANRWRTVLANYGGGTLLALAPVLLAAELAIVTLAVREGWLRQKLAAWGDVLRGARVLGARRRRVQAARRVGDGEILRLFTGALDTPLASSPGTQVITPALEAYRRALVRLLGAGEARDGRS